MVAWQLDFGEHGQRNGHLDPNILGIENNNALESIQPLPSVVPLQLLASHVAVLRGCNVDKPRNLAKSVTVE